MKSMWIVVPLAMTLVACEGEGGRVFGGGGSAYGGGGSGGSGTSFSGRAHTVNQDGYRHAQGYSTPFLCRENGSSVTCPTDVIPETDNLSCDASGCHGSYDYDPATPQSSRDLDGWAGPSCYDCHGQEWNSTKTAGGNSGGSGGGGDDEWEDDDD